MRMLDGVVPDLDSVVDRTKVSPDKIPQYAQFSDSIVLCAPLTVPNDKNYSGLELVVMRCIQIAQIALANGYLVRGAIDIGRVVMVGRNLAGRPFNNVVKAEKRTCRPRIILCPNAIRRWKDTEARTQATLPPNRMCIDYKSKKIVHVLHSHYFQPTPGRAAAPGPVPIESIDDRYREYLQTVVSNGRAISLSNWKGWSKWRWMQAYIKFSAKCEGIELRTCVRGI